MTATSARPAWGGTGLMPTLSVVGGLHVLALLLLLGGGLWSGLGLGMVAVAYSRGLLHAIDADHLAMIDGSTRKLLGEGRNPAGVGLAFSLGHSTVVLGAGVAVVAGATWVRAAIDPDTYLALVLGTIGASASAVYLFAVAAANTPMLVRALRGCDSQGHAHTSPHGWARVLSAPLSRVRHAGHVYLFGLLFGLGFDTASTIAVLMLTAAGSFAGVPPLALLAFPLAFAAAMTLGDSTNATIMLKVYSAADTVARRRLNIVLLTVSIVAATAVAAVTVVGLIGAWGLVSPPEIDTTWLGWGLAGVAVLGGLWLWLTRVADSR